MGKQEFLDGLRRGLSGLSQDEVGERINFYSEMIDDQMEEGLSEAEAVGAVGTIEEILAQILGDAPNPPQEKEAPRHRRWGEILLLVLGSPIWLSLGIAALAVGLSLYFSLWAVILSLWAVFASLAAGSLGGVLAWVALAARGQGAPGAAMLAGGIFCAGLAIFLFFGCQAATKGSWSLTKKLGVWIRRPWRKKEDMK